MHLLCVLGTIVGLFVPGSPYIVYRQMNNETCGAHFKPGMNATDFPFELDHNNFALSFKSECDPVPSLWSIGRVVIFFFVVDSKKNEYRIAINCTNTQLF